MEFCQPSFDLIDPVLVEIPLFINGWTLPIRWYALAYLAGLFGGYYYVRQLISRPALWSDTGKGKSPLSPAFVDDLLLWVMVGVIAGGRLGFVLFYQTSAIWERPVWVVTGITEGGMSFHGGLIGVALALYFTSRQHKVPLLRVADVVAAATPIGLFFGRLANFINGELWGRPAPDLPWAMRFAADPTCQLRHPSQLYEATLEGLVLFTIIAFLVWKLKALTRPGLATGVFLIGYGVFRAMVELVREPDRQMPEALQGYVTMGMLLCIPMIAAGGYLLYRIIKSEGSLLPKRSADAS